MALEVINLIHRMSLANPGSPAFIEGVVGGAEGRLFTLAGHRTSAYDAVGI
jgi:hypothetical protein